MNKYYQLAKVGLAREQDVRCMADETPTQLLNASMITSSNNSSLTQRITSFIYL